MQYTYYELRTTRIMCDNHTFFAGCIHPVMLYASLFTIFYGIHIIIFNRCTGTFIFMFGS